jgi:hypothetical protein
MSMGCGLRVMALLKLSDTPRTIATSGARLALAKARNKL